MMGDEWLLNTFPLGMLLAMQHRARVPPPPPIAHRQSISSVRRFGESRSSNALFIRFSLPCKVHFVELCGAEVSSLTYLRAKGIIYNTMGTGMTHLLS